MAKLSVTNILIYLVAILIVLLLLGLVGAKPNVPKNSDNPYQVENFFSSPDVSNETGVEGGASSLYGWSYNPIEEGDPKYRRHRRNRRKNIQCPKCDYQYVDQTDMYVVPPSDEYCKNCDITLNKDIDKYVLKSSIPPCPNMDEYARKNELPPWFNHDEWVRKSDIPPCPPVPDMDNYILKSDVPGCEQRDCPKCPVCPECPKCPPCPPDRVKVVEKVVYRKPEQPFAQPWQPQALGDYFPQTGGPWQPRLSNTETGFIPQGTPLAANLAISRGRDEMIPRF